MNEPVFRQTPMSRRRSFATTHTGSSGEQNAQLIGEKARAARGIESRRAVLIIRRARRLTLFSAIPPM
jgi:hypothetical protein